MHRIYLPALIALAASATAAVPVVTPHVVLNEVLYDPLGADAGAEAVELHNPTAEAVNLTGWTLADDDACRIGSRTVVDYGVPISGVVPALGHLVVAIPNVGSVPKCLSLANTGDVVILRNATGAEVDRVAWPAHAPARVDEGQAIARCFVANPGPALATEAAWVAAAPTLGSANAPCLGS